MGIFLFFLLSGTCLAALAAMIFSRNQAHNALFLVLAFSALGGLFGLLDAPFIAAVQIIIYAGAIMVLFIFVIMMINLKQGIPPERKKWTAGLASILGLILLVEIIIVARRWISSPASPETSGFGHPKALGHLLFTKYLYPFEITSILIIAALVGAIVISKKKEGP